MKFPSLPVENSQESAISFDAVDIDLPNFDQDALRVWLSAVAKTYDQSIGTLCYVLCTDAYLLEMNVERLDHDTYTDIITFDLRDTPADPIEGECYISLDRVVENAASFGESLERELRRVIVHGLLHLCGLGDKSKEESQQMRLAEEKSLHLFGA